MVGRRNFLKRVLLITGSIVPGYRFLFSQDPKRKINTVTGQLNPSDLGITLIHEHVLVDFIGAAETDSSRWNPDTVVSRVLPFFRSLKKTGCNTLLDCTPNYLGRDVVLLKKLSEESEINIVTNTGYYGGSDNKFLPAHAFEESEQQLADRWIKEWSDGIDGTAIKPGFIKISVNSEKLSDISIKLIKAAALTHLKTGLSIFSHTGPYIPAAQQVDMLKEYGVDPSAFVWVHAQNEKTTDHYLTLATRGAWVSLDGLDESNVEEYVRLLTYMKTNKILHRTLVSHDAGWYDPEKTGGGEIRGYTTLFQQLIPRLKKEGFTKNEIDLLLRLNPREMLVN